MENTVNAQPVDNAVEKPYTLRPLRDEDLWPVLGIIGKVIPDDLAPMFSLVASGEKTVKQAAEEIGYDVGFKLVVAVIRNIPVIKDEVYSFLSSLSGIPADVIPTMKVGTTPKMIWDIYHDLKNADFFGAASRSS